MASGRSPYCCAPALPWPGPSGCRQTEWHRSLGELLAQLLLVCHELAQRKLEINAAPGPAYCRHRTGSADAGRRSAAETGLVSCSKMIWVSTDRVNILAGLGVGDEEILAWRTISARSSASHTSWCRYDRAAGCAYFLMTVGSFAPAPPCRLLCRSPATLGFPLRPVPLFRPRARPSNIMDRRAPITQTQPSYAFLTLVSGLTIVSWQVSIESRLSPRKLEETGKESLMSNVDCHCQRGGGPPSGRSTALLPICRRISSALWPSRVRLSAQVEAAEVDEVILGQVLSAGQGQNRPARPRWRRASRRKKTRLGLKPALRLGPAHRSDRHAADCQWRCQHHRGWRPGIDDALAAWPISAPARRWAI